MTSQSLSEPSHHHYHAYNVLVIGNSSPTLHPISIFGGRSGQVEQGARLSRPEPYIHSCGIGAAQRSAWGVPRRCPRQLQAIRIRAKPTSMEYLILLLYCSISSVNVHTQIFTRDILQKHTYCLPTHCKPHPLFCGVFALDKT